MRSESSSKFMCSCVWVEGNRWGPVTSCPGTKAQQNAHLPLHGLRGLSEPSQYCFVGKANRFLQGYCLFLVMLPLACVSRTVQSQVILAHLEYCFPFLWFHIAAGRKLVWKTKLLRTVCLDTRQNESGKHNLSVPLSLPPSFCLKCPHAIYFQ